MAGSGREGRSTSRECQLANCLFPGPSKTDCRLNLLKSFVLSENNGNPTLIFYHSLFKYHYYSFFTISHYLFRDSCNYSERPFIQKSHESPIKLGCGIWPSFVCACMCVSAKYPPPKKNLLKSRKSGEITKSQKRKFCYIFLQFP